MTHIPPILRSRRALAALAILGVAAFLVAPDAIVRGLPFIVLLACPLMMVFMMGAMHRMPDAGGGHRDHDPYAQEALTKRLAELDAERVAITDLLAGSSPGRSAGPPSGPLVSTPAAAHVEHA